MKWPRKNQSEMTPPDSTFQFTPRHARRILCLFPEYAWSFATFNYDRSLGPDFPPWALQELSAIGAPAGATDDVRDMRDRLWASIDNDDSRECAGPEPRPTRSSNVTKP